MIFFWHYMSWPIIILFSCLMKIHIGLHLVPTFWIMFVVLHLGECNVVLCVSLIQLCTNDRPIILTILLYSHIVFILYSYFTEHSFRVFTAAMRLLLQLLQCPSFQSLGPLMAMCWSMPQQRTPGSGQKQIMRRSDQLDMWPPHCDTRVHCWQVIWHLESGNVPSMRCFPQLDLNAFFWTHKPTKCPNAPAPPAMIMLT